ncbi:MAG: hypothetical protein IJH42_07640, partial [Atopobiaceae bacterium]|nr:hypothetical protein [Atopobiaceae bacterium]
TYFFDRTDGHMLKGGIYEVDGSKYYFRPTGVMGRGWLVDYEGQTYFFDRTDGHMFRNGMFDIDGATYLFDADGCQYRGWLDMSDGRHCFDPATGVYTVALPA